jgi:hypothetical protein
VALELFTRCAGVRLLDGNPARGLHDEHDKIAEHDFAQGDEEPVAVPEDEAVFKLMYLALRNICKRWTMLLKNWSEAMNQFAIPFDGRVPMGGLCSVPLTPNI